MTDIVKRLNSYADWFVSCALGNVPEEAQMCMAAAEEIEQLRKAIDTAEIEHGLTSDGSLWRFWSAKAKGVAAKYVLLKAENDRLHSELANARNAALEEAADLLEMRAANYERISCDVWLAKDTKRSFAAMEEPFMDAASAIRALKKEAK